MKRLTMAGLMPSIIFFCFTTLPGCNSQSSQPPENPPIIVKTETVTESDQMNILSYAGVVEDISSVALSFPVPGQ